MSIIMVTRSINIMERIISKFIAHYIDEFSSFNVRKICVIVRKNLYFLFYSGYSYAKDYYKGGGYICPSDIFYGRPKRSINTYGQWKVISLRIKASQSMDIN